jgi:hypothetical protein
VLPTMAGLKVCARVCAHVCVHKGPTLKVIR